MTHNEKVNRALPEATPVTRLEWSNIRSMATDVAHVRGGVRVELPALSYNQVVDLVNRETQCCGNWLELDLTRQDSLLMLSATARTHQGRSTIRSLVGFDSY